MVFFIEILFNVFPSFSVYSSLRPISLLKNIILFKPTFLFDEYGRVSIDSETYNWSSLDDFNSDI